MSSRRKRKLPQRKTSLDGTTVDDTTEHELSEQQLSNQTTVEQQESLSEEQPATEQQLIDNKATEQQQQQQMSQEVIADKQQQQQQQHQQLVQQQQKQQLSGDLLTCGACQAEFLLCDILHFIEHKIKKCSRKNFHFITTGHRSPPTKSCVTNHIASSVRKSPPLSSSLLIRGLVSSLV